MGRAMVLVCLVGVLLAVGVIAGATSEEAVRLPLTPAATTTSTPSTVVVQKGDHLWKISARHLEHGTPVAPYWREVVELNTPRLRSGDPDLIYPGEVVELPEVSEPR